MSIRPNVHGFSYHEISERCDKGVSVPSTSETESAEAGGWIRHPVLRSPKLRFLFQIPKNVGLSIPSPMSPPYQLNA